MYALVHTTNHAYTNGRAVETECVQLSDYCLFYNTWGEKRYTLILTNGQRWSVPADQCVIYWN